MTKSRLIMLWAGMGLFVLAAPAVMLGSYYAYRKVTFPYEFCGSYGEIDAELGWRLRAGARSCLNGRNRLTGERYFESRIFVNRDGFRDVATDREAQPGGVITIGDSATFGYGLDFEGSYPYQLAAILGRPVVNLAVPAYGAAQTMLRLERHVAALRPRAVVFLDLGLWDHSQCEQAERPTKILIPCFWWNRSDRRIELVRPAPGYVVAMVKRNVYPGGFLSVGADSWAYFLISRPYHKIREYAGAAIKSVGWSRDTEFPLQEMLRFKLARFAALARRHDFQFVLVDNNDTYRAAHDSLPPDIRRAILRIGPAQWQQQVGDPSASLPAAERRVQRDGHLGPGANRLLAKMVANALRDAGTFAAARQGSSD